MFNDINQQWYLVFNWIIMNYKDLNVYQRAYKVAIDLHLFLGGKNIKVIPQNANDLRRSAREILANIAESFSQRTAKAKRFYNFKALDATRQMLMDLEFLHDLHTIPSEEYEHFMTEFEICAKQLYKLNQSILDKEMEKEPEPVAAPSSAKRVKA